MALFRSASIGLIRAARCIDSPKLRLRQCIFGSAAHKCSQVSLLTTQIEDKTLSEYLRKQSSASGNPLLTSAAGSGDTPTRELG